MKRSFAERAEAYPELKEHMERMIDIIENVEGKADYADDAEAQIVENMRKIGSASMGEWAVKRETTVSKEWVEKQPSSVKHGKKKSTGKQPWAERK